MRPAMQSASYKLSALSPNNFLYQMIGKRRVRIGIVLPSFGNYSKLFGNSILSPFFCVVNTFYIIYALKLEAL